MSGKKTSWEKLADGHCGMNNQSWLLLQAMSLKEIELPVGNL